ncbi:hypothetical protein [Paenibacillus xanthanilyticus]|uniref:Uncharacterized protein n=1 Tax=Paenibacillus xanthanilyticus TaxID=1783531 RepID=A0ABV8K8U0_9BACL
MTVRRRRKRLLVCSAVIAALIAALVYSRTMYVSRFYNEQEITNITMTLSDVKAGLEKTMTTSVTITGEEQLQAVADALRHRTLIRTMPRPSWIPTASNSNDFLELTIALTSTEEGMLEYRIHSEGRVEVRRGNDAFAKAVVLKGSAESWFAELKRLYDAHKPE